MSSLSLLALALSSSLDNLGVGISYGIRNIRIPPTSHLCLILICFVFSLFGTAAGSWFEAALPAYLPTLIASAILFAVGGYLLFFLKPTMPAAPSYHHFQTILAEPMRADTDTSGDIDLSESILLGTALSANSLVGGFSAGFLGLSPFLLALLSALFGWLTLLFGIRLGRQMYRSSRRARCLGDYSTKLSGMLLIGLACYTLFR